ncbi:MAG: PAS domain S-box protein [Desulfobulbaceae bacterium]|nr:PAS domain S-box protein [Desulfobulbaceae bacterium]
MTVSWIPVIAVDIIGSFLTLVIAFACAYLAWDWNRKKREDIFRDYIFLLTLAFVFFAISRSFGHLIKQFLIFADMNHVWQVISPFSGAVNSAAFIIIFAFGIYFQRFRKIHGELEEYKDNLEELVAERTNELEKVNVFLEDENRQRKQAEEGLRQTMTTLENIFNSTSPTCITDVDHKLVEANEAYQAHWPGPTKDGKSIKCFESRPSPICHTDNCPLEKIIMGGDQTTCETTRTSLDGITRVFLQTTKPFKDADGNLAGTVTSFQEITERKRAQEELAAERERLSVTLRSIGDGVITTDIGGKVVLLNKVAEKLCGWQMAEAEGKMLDEIFQIVDEKNGEPCENPVDQVLTKGHIIALESNAVLLARDGRRINISDSAAPIRDAQSRTIGVVLVFRDVTNQIRLEKELQKNQKLESVGILAGGIAHDFNNILSGVLGNINLAMHRLDENNPVTPLLQEAEKASLRAKGLTQQLLTFAKGGSPIRKKVSIDDVVKDSAVFVLRGSNVSCEIDIPDDLWLVEIDPGQMSQVIQNMILNAREAMEGGGAVTISARNREGIIESLDVSQRHWVEITIIDEGPGMGQEVVDRIFDPYFTTKDKGSGLGLSICHSIISQHNGAIQVTSTPVSGTIFTIILPALCKQKVHDQVRVCRKFPYRKGVRILVMDDEKMVRKILREMLSHLGFEPIMVSDGQQAVEQYSRSMQQGNKFDLVIMDLTIPGGMGGREAAQEILKLDPEALVIVSSGYSNDPIMSSFEKYGFCAAVIKPFQLQELSDAIENAMHLES